MAMATDSTQIHSIFTARTRLNNTRKAMMRLEVKDTERHFTCEKTMQMEKRTKVHLEKTLGNR